MEGEFQSPGERLNETGRGRFDAVRVEQGHVNVRTLLKGREVNVDADASPVGKGFSAQAGDVRLFGSLTRGKIVGEEEVHISLVVRWSDSLLVEQERRLGVMAHAFVLDTFLNPMLEIFALVFDGLSARKFVQWIIEMQGARRSGEARDARG